VISFNPLKTKAVIVGTIQYKDFIAIEPAKNNVVDIENIFSNIKAIGIPKENISSYIDVEHDKILCHFLELTNEKKHLEFDTFIFYYVGHGYRDIKSKELYLTTVNSLKKIIEYSSLPFKFIKENIESSHFQNRIFIIDACYSGLATLDDESNVYFQEQEDNIAKGTYILASSSSSAKSLYNSDERNTFFTHELIKIIKNGVENNSNVLSLDTIYEELKKSLKGQNLPEPTRKTNLNTSIFYFCNNLFIHVNNDVSDDIRPVITLCREFCSFHDKDDNSLLNEIRKYKPFTPHEIDFIIENCKREVDNNIRFAGIIELLIGIELPDEQLTNLIYLLDYFGTLKYEDIEYYGNNYKPLSDLGRILNIQKLSPSQRKEISIKFAKLKFSAAMEAHYHFDGTHKDTFEKYFNRLNRFKDPCDYEE
jgi:hypothetical protein